MILSLLKMAQPSGPPFASLILFELWAVGDEYWVNMIYNSEVMDLYKYCYGAKSDHGEKRCEFRRFKEKLLVDTESWEDTKKACREDGESQVDFLKGDGNIGRNKRDFYLIVPVLNVLLLITLFCCYKAFTKFKATRKQADAPPNRQSHI